MADRERYYVERVNRWKTQLGGKCVNCGSTEQLEFHHKDRDTKWKGITEIWGYAEDIVQEELTKCELVCKLCHQEVTRKEVYGEREHGTVAMYSRGKCRCDSCRHAWNEHSRNYRREVRAYQRSLR